jgi:hypothetical protein
MRSFGLAFFALGATLLSASCDDKQCELSADCLEQQRCEQGTCVAAPPPPPPSTRDGGVGFIPGADATPDAGVRSDAAPLPDGGGADGGAGLDGALEGYPWVEIEAGDVRTDVSYGPELEVRLFRWMDPPQVTNYPGAIPCNLIDRAPLGTPRPMSASRLRIEGTAAGMVELTPAAPGYLRPSMAVPPLFGSNPPPPTVRFQLYAGAGSDAVGDTSISLRGVPPMTSSLPPAGTTVSLQQPVRFLWTPSSGAPPFLVTAELASADRGLLLRCTSPDLGSLTLPDAPVLDFRGRSPAVPVTAELRYEESVDATAPLVSGGAAALSVHMSSGQRWPATP